MKPYFRSSVVKLYLGDCLKVMEEIDTSKVCMVFADLPYGKTANKWDIPMDLAVFWKLVPRCTNILTASNGFEFVLHASNPSAGFALAKKRPLNVTEDVLVFRASDYRPQMEKRGKPRKKGGYGASTNYGIVPSVSTNNLYYPKSLINISNCSQNGKRHPTQKPVELLEYLIRTLHQRRRNSFRSCYGKRNNL